MVMACWQASKAIWLESRRCNTVNPLPAAAKAMTNTTAMIMADFFAFHTFATAEVRGASEEGSRAGMEPCSGTVEGKRYTRSPHARMPADVSAVEIVNRPIVFSARHARCLSLTSQHLYSAPVRGTFHSVRNIHILPKPLNH